MHCQRVVILGDAHLGRGSPETERALLAFLETVPDLGDGLVITGDLFEFWFSYHRAVPRRNLATVAGLAALRRKVPILMVGGNHDRWGGEFWDTEFGIEFAPVEATFQLAGRRALALHGDGITENHWSGRLLQKVVRNPATVALFRAIHPDAGFWLVDHLSGALGNRARSEPEIAAASAHQAAWARARLDREPDMALLAMGHVHRAAALGSPASLYVNPGAWFDGYRYAVVDPSGATLAQFPGH